MNKLYLTSIILTFMIMMTYEFKYEPHIFKKLKNVNVFFQIRAKQQENSNSNQEIQLSNSTANDETSTNNTLENSDSSMENSTNLEESNETSDENNEINYDILEDEHYGPEIEDIKNTLQISRNKTIDKIDNLTQHIKDKIDIITTALENKLNNFTNKLINQAEELDKLMLFNELELLKLGIEIYKAQISEINSEIYKLKAFLSKLLKGSAGNIQTICNLYKSCGECLRNKHCGWCQEQEKCMLGDEKGPRFDLCQFYNYKLCDSNNCLKYKTCKDCLEDPFCGWCVDENKKQEGCIQGLSDFKSCPAWYYSDFYENPKCPPALKKNIKINKTTIQNEINFENIPEEQRILFFQKEQQIIELDQKIQKVIASLAEIEDKILFYERKYKTINGKINMTEIEEIRKTISKEKFEKINTAAIHEKEKTKLNFKNINKTSSEIEQSGSPSEETSESVVLDNAEASQYMSSSFHIPIFV